MQSDTLSNMITVRIDVEQRRAILHVVWSYPSMKNHVFQMRPGKSIFWHYFCVVFTSRIFDSKDTVIKRPSSLTHQKVQVSLPMKTL